MDAYNHLEQFDKPWEADDLMAAQIAEGLMDGDPCELLMALEEAETH